MADDDRYGLECNPHDGRVECWIKRQREDGHMETIDSFDATRLSLDCNSQPMCNTDGAASCDIWCEEKLFPKLGFNPEEGGVEYNNDIDIDVLQGMVKDMLEAEEIKPGFIRFLIDNNVTVMLDSQLEDVLGWKGVARCRGVGKGEWKGIAYSPESSNRLRTLLHEWAHCREEVARRKKGLEPLGEETGWWESYPHKLMPRGHEKRAVKFTERMERKRKAKEEP